MSWLRDLIRPDLQSFAAYGSARTEAGAFVPTLPLDANEGPWSPFGPLGALEPLNRYPDPQPADLRRRLATLYGVLPDQLLITRGSDEGMDVLMRLFCRAGVDSILICPPTYGMYEVYAATQGAAVQRVPLRAAVGWQLDLPALESACTPETKLIFIPSPTAPMGHVLRREDVLALCKSREGKSLIVMDEAYVDFSDNPKGFVPDLVAHPNLVILRTLSKSYALAGERLGAVLALPELIEALRRILSPYPLTQTSIRAAKDALSPAGLLQSLERQKILIAERVRMTDLLPRSSWIKKVFPSQANFVLAETSDSSALMEHLKRFGILIRNRHTLIPNTVRFTLGSPEQNDIVLRALGVDVPKDQPGTTPRLFSVRRATKETKIDVTVNLDSPGFLDIATGIGFFDHMLSQIATHGGFGLCLQCKGDLEVDPHHTIEDCALALGEALRGALGDKKGLARFGFTTPLDEALAQVVIDLSGRPFAAFEGSFPALMVGEMPTEMVPHFFMSLATALGASLHVNVTGTNAHHMIEACFKATGRALRQALRREGADLPSTKGVL